MIGTLLGTGTSRDEKEVSMRGSQIDFSRLHVGVRTAKSESHTKDECAAVAVATIGLDVPIRHGRVNYT